MKFTVKQEIFDIFPELKIGVVVGKGLRIGKRSNELETLIKKNVRKLVETVGENKLTDFKNISAWRETYRKFGVNPKKYKPTAEAFLKRMLKGHGFPDINSAVDAYLAVELLFMLPIGGYDLGKISGDIVLRISPGEEIFQPIGSENTELTKPGEIVYADEQMVLTRNWNFRDSDRTKITENTRDILLASEAALGEIAEEDLIQTVGEIVEYESLYCQGEYHTFFLDKKNSQLNINHI